MLRPLAAAFGFLTRFPVLPHDVTAVELGRSIAWFPLVGLTLGGAAVTATAATAAVDVDPTLAAIAVVALGASLTGGLHLDGVADVADGLGGGRGDRARSLAIMRDSRIGAFGAIALGLLLLAKVHATALVLAHRSPAALLAAPVVARALASACIVGFPYARADGLGRVFRDHGRRRDAAFALALAAAVTLLVALPVAALAAAAAALALALHLHRRLGGLTGDAYGAVIESAELALLATAATQVQ